MNEFRKVIEHYKRVDGTSSPLPRYEDSLPFSGTAEKLGAGKLRGKVELVINQYLHRDTRSSGVRQ